MQGLMLRSINNEIHKVITIMNTIKQILAHILFYLGDKVSYLMDYDKISNYVYPIYNKLMRLSCELDVNQEIWEQKLDSKKSKIY